MEFKHPKSTIENVKKEFNTISVALKKSKAEIKEQRKDFDKKKIELAKKVELKDFKKMKVSEEREVEEKRTEETKSET